MNRETIWTPLLFFNFIKMDILSTEKIVTDERKYQHRFSSNDPSDLTGLILSGDDVAFRDCPIAVREVEDGKYVVLDGHTRLGAAKIAKKDIAAVILDLDESEGIRYSRRCNLHHGVPLTHEEKRSLFLKRVADPGDPCYEFGSGLIAREFGVSKSTAKRWLKLSEVPKLDKRVGLDGSLQPTIQNQPDDNFDAKPFNKPLSEKSERFLNEILSDSSPSIQSIKAEVEEKIESGEDPEKVYFEYEWQYKDIKAEDGESVDITDLVITVVDSLKRICSESGASIRGVVFTFIKQLKEAI